MFQRDGLLPGNLDRSSIWTIGVDAKHPRLVYRLPKDRPGGGGGPRWSPDGSRILFSDICYFASCRSAPPLVPQIFTIRPNGSDLQQLTHGSASAFFPAWSPDGRWIVFSRSVESYLSGCPGLRAELYVMKADGTEIHRITTSTADGCDPDRPDWGK